jgi:hypothetical protein
MPVGPLRLITHSLTALPEREVEALAAASGT